jgi:predicted alpha/beta-hydrolase family hydrolase
VAVSQLHYPLAGPAGATRCNAATGAEVDFKVTGAAATATTDEALTLELGEGTHVSALLTRPATDARAGYVMAHGAGAGMRHPFMGAVASELAAHAIATLRYQFPYMEKRARRPDPPPLCHATVRAAVAAAGRRLPGLALVAGGRSFGGRMSSQAQAEAPLPAVQGLAFLGFPLHPAGRPGTARAEHLARVALPMLFVQGTRDALAERPLLQAVLARLGSRADIEWVEGADHSFHVPARTGRQDDAVRRALVAGLAQWILAHA